MKYTYCPKCSKKLTDRDFGDEGIVKFCFNCNLPYFETPTPCVEVIVINEKNQILLLKQNYISKTHWTVVSGYVKIGDTIEHTVIQEVLEETGQVVEKMQYIESYYFEPKELIMIGYVAFVRTKPFVYSHEVDDIMWCDIDDVNKYIARVNNLSGIHFDKVRKKLGL